MRFCKKVRRSWSAFEFARSLVSSVASKWVNIYSQTHAVAKDVLPGCTTSVETPLSINLLARALFQSNKAVFDCPNAFQASYVSPCCIIFLGLSANVVRHTSKLMSSRFTSPNSYPKLPTKSDPNNLLQIGIQHPASRSCSSVRPSLQHC